ncbi:ABC transporter ATP-binding protein [Halocola ammonii]
MIEIKDISKRYGKQQVLQNIHLDFSKGQSIALIGPNGSGKTTLMKSILGLVIPDSGSVLVNGKSIDHGPNYRRDIGYMPQINRFPEQMKVDKLFQLMIGLRPDVEKDNYDLSLYEELDIDKMKGKALGSLSGGMKQQVSASLAFYFNPEILILDEPTAALDPISNEILKSKIRKTMGEGRLVITTSHILSDLEEISNHVVYLQDGRVHFNKSIEELKQETDETKLNKMIVSLLQKEKSHA